ncbi:dual specificity protein phosphatase family protein [Niveibacterium sp.]|uniref:protein-tyrosine phosphatase family protein n=1 Tax=Niveibacterium sp. TaxID=2017444 RepID=UPI0035B01048
MDKSYHALIDGRIYFGGAADVPAMIEQEAVEVVVDLREESTGLAADAPTVQWQRIPLGDNNPEPQDKLFGEAIQAVVAAHRAGKRVAFHCGGGKGRTGTVAAGVLLELGVCHSFEEAQAYAKAIRPVINIKPEQREALEALYPQTGATSI